VRPYGPDSPWRFAPGLTYLTHGTFGACPVPVLEAQRAFIDELEASPVHILDRSFETRLDAARTEVASFLNADPEGTVVVPNATTGVSTVLRSLRLRPGDELLATDHEYNAVLNAIQGVADDAKARVIMARIPMPIRHPEEVVEALLAAVTPRTRIAVVSHVTSPTGLVFPIEAIVRELDRLGVDTLVDAAHAPGAVAVDVTALGAAYWTANGHKWLCGPKTEGVLVVREDRRAGVRPLVTSHGRNDPRDDRPQLWKAFDWLGTLDPTAFLALPVALRLVGGLDPAGWPGVMARNHALVMQARERLQELFDVEPLAPESMVGAMATVRVPSLHTDAEAQALTKALHDEDRIEVPFPGWPVRGARASVSDPPSLIAIRVSAQLYNDAGDIDRLADALVRRGVAAPASAIVNG